MTDDVRAERLIEEWANAEAPLLQEERQEQWYKELHRLIKQVLRETREATHERNAALTDALHRLTMLGLQSDRYREDAEFREVVDAGLSLTVLATHGFPESTGGVNEAKQAKA